MAFLDDGAEGGFDGGVAEAFALQFEVGAEAFDLLDEVAGLVDGGVVGGLGGLVAGAGLVEFGLGADVLVDELAGAFEALFGFGEVGSGAADIGGFPDIGDFIGFTL